MQQIVMTCDGEMFANEGLYRTLRLNRANLILTLNQRVVGSNPSASTIFSITYGLT